MAPDLIPTWLDDLHAWRVALPSASSARSIMPRSSKPAVMKLVRADQDGNTRSAPGQTDRYPQRPPPTSIARSRHMTITIDLEQKTLQLIDNPFGTRLSPMS